MALAIPRTVPRLVALVTAALLIAALVAVGAWRSPALAQSAAQTWEIQVGLTNQQTGAEVHAFGPNPITIRVGDTVSWKFASFHTVTFNAFKPDLPVFVPGPGPGEFMAGAGVFPAGPASGSSYDGSVQASSGAPLQGPPDQFGYSLKFTKAGMFGYVCTIHPGMRGEIQVVDATSALPETVAASKARGQATLAALAGKASTAKTHAAGPEHLRPAAANAGTTTVFVGVADPYGASFLGFVNGDVTVPRGGEVAWVWADPFEIHTVTFLSGAQPPAFIIPRPQPAGPPVLVINPDVLMPSGGSTYTGQGVMNSGILEAPGLFVARFDAPAGKYEYICATHQFMKGSVTVT